MRDHVPLSMMHNCCRVFVTELVECDGDVDNTVIPSNNMACWDGAHLAMFIREEDIFTIRRKRSAAAHEDRTFQISFTVLLHNPLRVVGQESTCDGRTF